MPFPVGTPTVTLTGTVSMINGASSTAPQVSVSSPVVIDATGKVIYDGAPIRVPVASNGQWSVTLLANDAPGISPRGFTYDVQVRTSGSRLRKFVALPSAPAVVDFASLVSLIATTGSVIAPAFVTSVNGLTGAVTIATGAASFPPSAVGFLRDDGTGTRAWALPTKTDVGLGAVDNVPAAQLRDRATHTGTQTLDTTTDTATRLALTPAERSKLGGVAAGATANATDAQLRDRSTHTGTQPASTVTGLAAVATSGLKADVGLGNVDNTSDANKPVSTATANALAAKADLVGGVIPTSQIPAIATSQTVTVASQAAMLALTPTQVQPGDVAIRSDQAGRRWLLAAADPSVLANWIQLEVPDAVSSVNGQIGAVVLAAADVGAVPTARTVTAGTGLTGGGDLTANRSFAVVYGTTAGTAAVGNDARLSDARTPTAHAASHGSGAADAVTIAEAQVTGLVADLAAKAPLASPAFTGTPTAPTAAAGTNTTQLATTAFVETRAGNPVLITSTGTGVVPHAVRSVTGQTGDLDQWQDPTGLVMSRVTAAGQGVFTAGRQVSVTGPPLVVGGTDGEGGGIALLGAGGTQWRIFADANASLKIGGGATSTFWEAYYFAGTVANLFKSAGGAAGQSPIVAQGVAGQTAGLQEWRDNTSTLSRMTNVGEWEMLTPGAGLYLRSPNNTRYRVTVTNTGALTTVAA